MQVILRKSMLLACVTGLFTPLSFGGVAQLDEPAKVEELSLQAILEAWSDEPRDIADRIMEKYGKPDAVDESFLVWFEAQPWKRIVLQRDGIPHNFPKPHMDYLEQVVNYQVPVEAFDLLAAYDGSVTVRRTAGEMSAMCDREAMNFLALNLAHDIIIGSKSVEEARDFYGQTVLSFMAGESPQYTQQLVFDPLSAEQSRDPDTQTVEVE